MIPNQIVLKSINEILPETFLIPSYQRGYRWTEKQVVDLLDDIWEFYPNKKPEEIYCLQPVVVKRRNDQWELIDGQQRLTTIFIILSYLQKRKFSIEFETREKSKEFLKTLTAEIDNSNIDFYHISKAFTYVKTWFEEKENIQHDYTIQDEFNIALGKFTKVIWYQVNDEQTDAVDIFTRINMGKIPLTNAELIKALFLKKTNFGDNDEKIRLKQLEISKDWDRMEYILQNDSFWYFLNSGTQNYVTRIEYIFDLIVNKQPKDDDYYTFTQFNDLLLKKGIEEFWLEVKAYFMTFEEWFNSKDLYHLVGYLVSVKQDIRNIKKEAASLSKSKFKDHLKSKIKGLLNLQLDDLEYSKKHYESIKKVLLLFNIQAIIDNKDSVARFPFDRFKKESWDVEHIHAVATEMPNTAAYQVDWLTEVSKDLKDEDLNEKITSFLSSNTKSQENKFEPLYNLILKHYSKNQEHEDVNDLRNLALLDSGTNRSYKNYVFPVKRKTILAKDKSGTFIPLGTKNVFMKYYSDRINQMSYWDKEDQQSYLANIKSTLKDYLPLQIAPVI
jgi:uncharacterized protein with ParB-like and HNH nuclease domain